MNSRVAISTVGSNGPGLAPTRGSSENSAAPLAGIGLSRCRGSSQAATCARRSFAPPVLFRSREQCWSFAGRTRERGSVARVGVRTACPRAGAQRGGVGTGELPSTVGATWFAAMHRSSCGSSMRTLRDATSRLAAPVMRRRPMTLAVSTAAMRKLSHALSTPSCLQ